MSLINDALKRARVSALEQEAEGAGVEYRAVPAHSRRRTPGMSHLAGWAVAAVAITVILYLTLRPQPSAQPELSGTAGGEVTAGTTPATQAAPPPSPAPVESPAAVLPLEVPEVESSAERAAFLATAREIPDTTPEVAVPSQQDRDSPSITEEEWRSAESRHVPAESPAGAPGAGPSSDPAATDSAVPNSASRGSATSSGPRVDASRRARGDLIEGHVYVRRAQAADGASVELGGIAFSDERPIAVSNGSVVTAGDMVEGFIVLRIEPERVWLEHGSTRIYLALR